MESEIAEVAQILEIVTSGGEELEAAQNRIYEMEEDPFTFLAKLLRLINIASDDKTKSRAALYICRVVNRITSIDVRYLEQLPEELLRELQATLLRFAQMTGPETMVNKIYDSIYALVKPFMSNWEGLIEILIQQCATTNAYQAIKAFALIAENNTAETINQEMLGVMIEIFGREYGDEKSRESQFNLYLSISHMSAEFLQENIERATILLGSLDSRLEYATAGITKFLNPIYSSKEMLEMYAPLYATLIEIFKKPDEATTIAAAECLESLVEFSEAQEFIISQIDSFVESVIFVLSEKAVSGDTVSCAVETVIALCEKAFKVNSSIMEEFESRAVQGFEAGNENLFAGLARIFCPPQYFPQLFSLMTETEDQSVTENALEALNKIFKESFEEVTESNEETMKQIFQVLHTMITEGDEESSIFNLSCRVLATFCESALENGHKQFIIESNEGIVEIIGKVFNENTMLAAATLTIVDDANEFAELYQTVTSYVLEALQNEDEVEFSNGVDLLKYESNFLKKLAPEVKAEFYKGIIEVIQARTEDGKYTDVLLHPGFGFCTKACGKEIVAEHLGTILELLIPKLLEPISVGYDSGIVSSEHVSFHIPGTNKKVIFKDEEVKERVCGLKNFVSIIDTLGADIEQIEGFMDNALKIINFAIHSPFAVEIRQEGFNIICAISKVMPQIAPEFMSFIHPFFIPSEEGEGEHNIEDIITEPENISRTSALKGLSEVIGNEDEAARTALQPFIQAIGELLPQLFIKEVNELLAEGCSEGTDEYQEYFDCLWEAMVLLNSIEKGELSPAKEISIGAYAAIMEFLGSVESELEIFELLKVGFTSDLLEYVPNYEGFDEAFGIIQAAVQSESADVRGTALYGFGRILSKKDGIPAETLDQMLEFLNAVLTSEEMSEPEFHEKKENGVSSFCLILKKRMTFGGDYVAHLQQLLEMLPVYNDYDESTIVYEFIIDCLNLGLPTEIKDVLFSAIVACIQNEDGGHVVTQIVQSLIEKIPANYRAQLQSE